MSVTSTRNETERKDEVCQKCGGQIVEVRECFHRSGDYYTTTIVSFTCKNCGWGYSYDDSLP